MKSSMTAEEFALLREGLAVTQEQLAKAMGVRARTISRWETTGNIPESAAKLLLLIAGGGSDAQAD
jgi:DNA-binding transcriptional regulator YiaG